MENQTKTEVTNREQQQEDVEDDDETKMEKFYSLIRSFREARDRRSQELAEMSKRRRLGLDHNHHHRHHHHVQSPSPSSLSPLITSPISFELRDFTAPVGAGAHHLPLSPSPPSAAAGGDDNNKRQKRREDSEEELNLNLSL